MSDEVLPPLYRVGLPPASLRIVYLVPRTGPGGGARVLLEHANHLHRLGSKVTVLSHFPRPDWFELEADFVEIPFGRPLCDSVPPCEVIVAGYWDEILPARRLGIAPVVHFEQGDFHLYDDVPEQHRAVIEASLAAADWTITVGEAAENALAERYGIFAHRITTQSTLRCSIPLAPSPSAAASSSSAPTLRCSRASTSPRKVAGALFMKATPRSASSGSRRTPRSGPSWRDHRRPAQESLARYLRQASAYVGTSRYESFPLPPLEAMASGTPVVSTDNGGILAYAMDGENCLLAPLDDLEALASAVRRVLDDAELAARSANGRASHGPLAQLALDHLPSCSRSSAPSSRTCRLRRRARRSSTDDLDFDDENDRSRLFELAEASPYESFEVPVSQPSHGEYRLVRWRAVAHKQGGCRGVGRADLPARCELPVEDAPTSSGSTCYEKDSVTPPSPGSSASVNSRRRPPRQSSAGGS